MIEVKADGLSQAMELIAAERRRQVEVEGFNAAHDDAHGRAELLRAAETYARFGTPDAEPLHPTDGVPMGWPWAATLWKPRGRLENLVRAGALAQAEVARLRRSGQHVSPHAKRCDMLVALVSDEIGLHLARQADCCLEVMPLIAGALLEERQHWREWAACHIDELVRALKGDRRLHLRPVAPVSALRQELAETVVALGEALEDDFRPRCGACGEPVRVGQAVLPDVEMGEIHADCGNPDRVAPGDKVFVDPESIVVEEGAEKPDHLVAGEAGWLMDAVQIAERLARGRAVLAGDVS